MSTYVIAAVLFVASVAAGLYALSGFSDEPKVSRGKKTAIFFAAFVGWPFALLVMLAVIVMFWDLMLLGDPDIDSLGEVSPPNPR